MRLLRPDLAVWLFAIPVVLVGWMVAYHTKWRGRAAVDAAAAARDRRLSRRSGRLGDLGILALGALTVALLVLALVRPQLLVEKRTPQMERPDLILIMDRSVSMHARDVRPSRFGWAVDEIKRFLERKPDAIGRVALIGFAATPVVLAYPTRDLESLYFYLDWARDDPTPLYGTDIGAALSRALRIVERDPQKLRPLFVLISDGDDQGSQLDRAATALREAKIPVHTIGIGSSRRVTIPIKTETGGEEPLKDDDGNLVLTTFSATTLERVAAVTGGRYVRSSAGGELLSTFETLAADSQRRTGWTTETEYRDLYVFFLAAAGLSGLGLVIRL